MSSNSYRIPIWACLARSRTSREEMNKTYFNPVLNLYLCNHAVNLLSLFSPFHNEIVALFIGLNKIVFLVQTDRPDIGFVNFQAYFVIIFL